jgi:hypothetical protein
VSDIPPEDELPLSEKYFRMLLSILFNFFVNLLWRNSFFFSFCFSFSFLRDYGYFQVGSPI